MNKKQRITLWVGAVLILLSFLYVPFVQHTQKYGALDFGEPHYSLVYDNPYSSGRSGKSIVIDWQRAYTQMFVTALLTGVAVATQKK